MRAGVATLVLLLAAVEPGHVAAQQTPWVDRYTESAVRRLPATDFATGVSSAVTPSSDVSVRPGLREQIAGVTRGRTQLELGYVFFSDEADGTRVSHHTVPDMLLRFGITDRLEIRFGWPGYVATRYAESLGGTYSDDRALDPNVGLMFDLWSQRGVLPQTAILASVPLTLEGSPFAMESLQPVSQILYRWDLTDRLAVGGTTGFALFEVAGDSYTQLQQTVALDATLTDCIGTFGEWEILSDNGTQHLLGGGVSWLATRRLQVTWRAGVGLNQPAPDFLTNVRFAWRF